MGKSKKSKKSKKQKASKTKDVLEFYNGTNIFTLPNGDTYFGEYCAHRSGLMWREGQGVYTTLDGQVYEGEWMNDKLIDGKNITITYKDKSIYEGPIMKYKCTGPGTLTFDSGIKISGNFQQNVPVGEILMIDINGKLWNGVTSEKTVHFRPENAFFTNIPIHRGKKKERLDELQPTWQPTPPITSLQTSQENLSTFGGKDDIFARKFKIDHGIDFKDSDWYQNYINYKNQRNIILGKVKAAQKLTPEEKEWHNNYLQARKQLYKRKESHFTKISDADSNLFEKFLKYTLEETNKCYTAIYPTYYWKQDGEGLKDPNVKESSTMHLESQEEAEFDQTEYQFGDIEESENEDTFGKIEVHFEDDKEEEIKSKLSVGADTDSLFNFVSKVLDKSIKGKCQEPIK